jgi:hypothetical protein
VQGIAAFCKPPAPLVPPPVPLLAPEAPLLPPPVPLLPAVGELPGDCSLEPQPLATISSANAAKDTPATIARRAKLFMREVRYHRRGGN